MQFSFVWNANIQIEVQEAAQSRLHVCGKGLNVCATAAPGSFCDNSDSFLIISND